MVQSPEPRSTRKEEGRDPLPLGPYPAAVPFERTELFAFSRARIHGFTESHLGRSMRGQVESAGRPVVRQVQDVTDLRVLDYLPFASSWTMTRRRRARSVWRCLSAAALRRRFLLRGNRRGCCQRFANAAGSGRQHEARRGGWRELEPRVRQRQATIGNVRQNVVANLKTGGRKPTWVRIPPPPLEPLSAESGLGRSSGSSRSNPTWAC
jgi:hypothetical protein